jgi:hypothetical protein
MRPYLPGQGLYNIIQTAIPGFVNSDYPLFVEFLTTFAQFLEQKRTFVSKPVYPQYGVVANNIVQATSTLGGPFYEARKFLEYVDTRSTLDEFKSHFLNAFAQHFPQYTYVSLDVLIPALRQFYQAKGTTSSIAWMFRVIFNEDAEVYFPRTDILKLSVGDWHAPTTLKVSSPVDGRLNGDVSTFYVGQRVQTSTGAAQVESVVTYVVGQAFNQNIIVNELTLKFGTIIGTFQPGQTLVNIDSTTQVHTIILPVIVGVSIASGGSNYLPGDLVTFSEGPGGGGGFGAFGTVSVISNTAINDVTVIDGGDGYTVGLPCVFTSTSGHGANAVVQTVVFGDLLLEDSSGYLTLEQQEPNVSNYVQLEDVNVLFLELSIEPFVNATSDVVILDPDYGVDAGVAAMDGVGYDSEIELALAIVNTKPFTIPWVFTNNTQTTATLVNASCALTFTSNTFFANGMVVYSLVNIQDTFSTNATANVVANAVIAQVDQGGTTGSLYLQNFVGLNKFTVGQILKADGAGIAQVGTITCDGSANLVGTSTTFTSVLLPNVHILLSDGSEAVIKNVVNNTLAIVFTALGSPAVANTWAIRPTGTVTSIQFEQQVYYGKIKTVRLLSEGAGYLTPPAVSCDSVSGRAQELFYLNLGAGNVLGGPNNSIVAAADQIGVFQNADLSVLQDSGQIQAVSIINSGVDYTDANSITITATQGSPRTGTTAVILPIIGALTNTPGEFTTSNGFLSADKFIEDSTFYNEYTYVVQAGESFDRYKDLLLTLVHPAGFQPLGQFVDIQVMPLTIPAEWDDLTPI